MSEGGAELGATRLIGDSFRLLFRHFRIFFPLALAPALLMEALNIALIPAPSDDPMAITTGTLLAAFLAALVGYVIVALLCVATLDALTGTRRPLEAYLRLAAPHALALFVLGTILSIAAGIAMLFLIVPGLYVFAQFMVWVQAVIFERAGFGGLGRAQALTRGHRWPLVGALLILVVLFLGGMLLTMPLFALGGTGPGPLVVALVSGVIVALTNALIAIFTTLVYLRLRSLKEGTSAEQVAASLR